MTTGPKKQAEADAPPAGDEQNFVARWSKRKHAARTAQEAPPPADQPIAEVPAAPVPVLTDKDMPPIESLTADSDYSGFFSPGVSEELRRLALRKLFHMPEFNTRCPLDSEYYDCTKLTDLGSIITHDMREQWEREAKELAAKALDKTLTNEPGGAQDPPVAQTETVAASGNEQVEPKVSDK